MSKDVGTFKIIEKYNIKGSHYKIYEYKRAWYFLFLVKAWVQIIMYNYRYERFDFTYGEFDIASKIVIDICSLRSHHKEMLKSLKENKKKYPKGKVVKIIRK